MPLDPLATDASGTQLCNATTWTATSVCAKVALSWGVFGRSVHFEVLRHRLTVDAKLFGYLTVAYLLTMQSSDFLEHILADHGHLPLDWLGK